MTFSQTLFITFILYLFLSGCTTIASREGDKMILRGWGAKSAEWPDGAKIEKEEPVRIPDITR